MIFFIGDAGLYVTDVLGTYQRTGVCQAYVYFMFIKSYAYELVIYRYFFYGMEIREYELYGFYYFNGGRRQVYVNQKLWMCVSE